MGGLNKFLGILLFPLILIIALSIADTYAPKAMKPAKLFTAIDTYRERLQNPLGLAAKGSADSVPGTTDEKSALKSLTEILNKNKDRSQANQNIDHSLDVIFEDDGTYKVGDPRLAELERREAEAKIKAEADRLALEDLQKEMAAKNPQPIIVEAKADNQMIVMDGSNGFVAGAEEQIRALAVPESVRQEILSNYQRTGILPAMLDSSRQPANDH